MKVIGLIGGMSWRSTLEYYRLISELVAARLRGLHSANIVLYSLDFAEVDYHLRESRWEDTADILIKAGTVLKQAGADFLVICNNSLHKVADAVAQSSQLPLINVIDAVGNSIVEHGLRRVGLLGTKYIMDEPFYRDTLKKQFGIDVLVPGKGDQAAIHNIIYQELYRGKINDASHRACLDIIEAFIKRGAEGIILGCNELPLIIRFGDAPVPLFNATRLHAAAAVRLALGE